MTASGFIGARDERGALGGGGGIEWKTSLAIGAIGGSGGGMLGAETRGATGAGAEDEVADPPCGTFADIGALGALGAIGAFADCGRNSEGATRTAGSAPSAPPDGVLPDRCPASFAIRKF